jgi:hypothetical protein
VAEEETRKRRDALLSKSVQGAALRAVAAEQNMEIGWAKAFLRLRKNDIKFGIDSLLDVAATPQRLKEWKVKDYRSGRYVVDDTCQLCKSAKGTLGHILGYCDVALGKRDTEFNRIAWRHDQVLRTLRDNITKHSKLVKSGTFELVTDLGNDKRDHVALMRSFDTTLKPDVILFNESDKKIILGELTCPMEHKMAHWNQFKTAKYEKLVSEIAKRGYTVTIHAFEVGCRGLVGNSIQNFLKALHLPAKDRAVTVKDASIAALQSSCRIFHARNSISFSLAQEI